MAWRKGESGNPNGRPKKSQTLTDILEQYGNKKQSGDTVARKRRLAERVWDLALEGDVTAIRYIYDRIDGKPAEKHQHTGEDGGPVEFTLKIGEESGDE